MNKSEITLYLKSQISGYTISDINSIDSKAELAGYGVSSIWINDLISKINEKYSVRLSPALLADMTIDKLADLLVKPRMRKIN